MNQSELSAPKSKREIRLINLPKVEDERGNLSFIEGENHIPFRIRRAYWIYDVPGGELRGSHAFRHQEEFIVALSGSFDVVLHDGKEERRIHLCRSYKGVYVPPMTWRTLDNFSTNSLGLVLSSTHYDEGDYLWDFETFRAEVAQNAADPCQIFHEVVSSAPEVVLPKHSGAYTLADCRMFRLPAFTERRRGYLTAIEEGTPEILPFALRRVFYLYDIPSDTDRGQHAHKQAWQFIVAASSSFTVELDDLHERRSVRLDRPFMGLLIPPGIWCRLHDFSSAAVALVLTSESYDPKDYICDYQQLAEFRNSLSAPQQ